MTKEFKLSKEEERMEKMAKGAGFLIAGLILVLGAGSFSYHFWSRLQFLLADGETPQVQTLDLSLEQDIEPTIKPGMVQVSGYPGPFFYDDYNGSLLDSFKSTKFVYVPLFKEPVSKPITIEADAVVYIKKGFSGYMGFYPSELSAEAKLADLASDSKVTFTGITGYTDGGDLTKKMIALTSQHGVNTSKNAVFLQEDSAHKWLKSGLIEIGMLLLTLLGLYLLGRAYKLLKHSIL